MDEGWKRAVEAAKATREQPNKPRRDPSRPPMCEECGVYRSDPPSKLCVGCEAYREHQR